MERLIFLPLLAFLLSGCVTQNRWADLRDCGEVSLGWGPGLAVDADLGWLSHPSLGIGQHTERIGIDSRDCWGRWSEREWVCPMLWAFALEAENGSFLWSHSLNRDPAPPGGTYPGEPGLWLPLIWDDERFWTFHNATDFSVSATLIYPSARIGINPLEIVDFTVGFFGADIADDDWKDSE